MVKKEKLASETMAAVKTPETSRFIPMQRIK
jgi:hypothetical protein